MDPLEHHWRCSYLTEIDPPPPQIRNCTVIEAAVAGESMRLEFRVSGAAGGVEEGWGAGLVGAAFDNKPQGTGSDALPNKKEKKEPFVDVTVYTTQLQDILRASK